MDVERLSDPGSGLDPGVIGKHVEQVPTLGVGERAYRFIGSGAGFP
jgi:hypothetical protein